MNSQGDSGGPATYKHGDQHILAGVIIAGSTDCDTQNGLVRIAFHRKYFIDDILNNARVCKHGVEADNWF